MSLSEPVLTGPGAGRSVTYGDGSVAELKIVGDQSGGDGTGALLVNVWVVSDGSQTEFVEAITSLYDYLCSTEGFIGGALLAGADPTRFISYARLRSRQDRQRLLVDDEVSARLRAMSQIARADLHSYSVLREFGPLVREPATVL